MLENLFQKIARDQNCAVWLVGCVLKFLHRIELHSIQCKFLLQVAWACVTPFILC